MPTTLPRRTFMQSMFEVLCFKTVTLSAGTNTVKAIALNAGKQYRSINFFIQDFDCTDACTIKIYAASAADGSGTNVEIHSKDVAVANNQTAVFEIDSSYISSVCDEAGVTPLSVVLKIEGAGANDTLAYCVINEIDNPRLGATSNTIG